MTAPTTPDPQKMLAALERVRGYAVGASLSALIALGRRMGLYGSLKEGGAVTSEELAERTGLHERWLLEWLRGQAAAGVVEYRGDGRFELSAEMAVVLADEDNLSFLGNMFDSMPHRMSLVDRMPEAFRTGIGLNWDERGPDAAAFTERTFRAWYRQVLVPTALPLLDGIVPRLEEGAKVADIGCGGGVALIEMARAFPRSEFHGYDISELALARADANREEAGTSNVSFHNAANDALPGDGSFSLITTLDVLHDMTHPDQAAAAARAAVRPDGAWFIIDIDGAPTFEENLQKPMTPMLYSFSVFGCLSSGLSEPDGAGLGTLGLPEPEMRKLTEAAGFTSFRRIDLPHPLNAFYEARP